MNCPYFESKKCQSCHLLDLSYHASLGMKESELRALFPDHVDLIKPTVGISGAIEHSRNKAKLAVSLRDNVITFGFFNSDGSHQELENCQLHARGINALLPSIRELLNKYHIIPYDIQFKKGELKYLLISSNDTDNQGEFLLRFVLRSKESLHRLKKAATELQSLHASIKVITANIQPIHQAIIEGDEEIILTPDAIIWNQFDEFQLALGAKSFFQVTPQIAKSLYNEVSSAIATDAPSSLIDLYCGVGAFSFYASRHCHDVTGVEISKDAIECATLSAKRNDTNIDFVAMDVERYLQQSDKKFQAMLVNPPRRGLNSMIITMIKQAAPNYIYYSSCNAETLARDFKELQQEYSITSLKIFDMFPFTKHYETLMCLSRVANS